MQSGTWAALDNFHSPYDFCSSPFAWLLLLIAFHDFLLEFLTRLRFGLWHSLPLPVILPPLVTSSLAFLDNASTFSRGRRLPFDLPSPGERSSSLCDGEISRQWEEPKGRQGEELKGRQGEEAKGRQGVEPKGRQGLEPKGKQGEEPKGRQGEELKRPLVYKALHPQDCFTILRISLVQKKRSSEPWRDLGLAEACGLLFLSHWDKGTRKTLDDLSGMDHFIYSVHR